MSISRITVLGGGSAGFMAAITLKRVLPHLEVTVVRSPEIGIIGVGEGTTPNFPRHLFRFLRLSPQDFYERVQPTWKLGIRFLWGEREEFLYTFDPQYSSRFPDLPRNNGFYCEGAHPDMNTAAALMAREKAFVRDAQGRPVIPLDGNAWHMENVKLVAWLEWQAQQLGVSVIDATVTGVERNGEEVAALQLSDGRRLTADLFVDASGFASRLIGQEFAEPFHDYSDTLFCDAAVIAPRERQPGEAILPYTTAETTDHGWCWRIDHEHHINRGYVYSSAFVSTDEAEAAFRRMNPGAGDARVVKFRSGRYRRAWVRNVVAVGNAAGFVEPLEATALMLLCIQCRSLAEALIDSLGEPGPALRNAYNAFFGARWDEIRDFLALHYRFNTRLDTPFWQHCRAATPLHSAAALVDFYQENGPSVLASSLFLSQNDQFGIEGYLALLTGMKVPHGKVHEPEPEEWNRLRARQSAMAARATGGISVAEALRLMRDPRWKWQAQTA